MQKELN